MSVLSDGTPSFDGAILPLGIGLDVYYQITKTTSAEIGLTAETVQQQARCAFAWGGGHGGSTLVFGPGFTGDCRNGDDITVLSRQCSTCTLRAYSEGFRILDHCNIAPPRAPPAYPPAPPSPPPCSNTGTIDPNTGTHGYSYVQSSIRMMGDWDRHMPDVSYPNGEYLLCWVIEDIGNVLGGEYGGVYNPPEWMTIGVPGSCASELYDTYDPVTLNPLGRPKDGYIHTLLGAISMTNYQPYSWPALGFSGPSFSYHLALFRRGDMATNDHEYLVNINRASQTGSGSSECLDGSDNCMRFGFIFGCNDFLSTEKLQWNDPPASCTTGPETDCYWSNVVIERSGAGGWGSSHLPVSQGSSTFSAGPGYYEWFTDSTGQSQQYNVAQHGFQHNIAPSPPGIAYEYAPSPPARRRELQDVNVEHEIAQGVEALRKKHRAEANRVIRSLSSIVNGSWVTKPQNESYKSMMLRDWRFYMKTELEPRWEDEIKTFRQNSRRLWVRDSQLLYDREAEEEAAEADEEENLNEMRAMQEWLQKTAIEWNLRRERFKYEFDEKYGVSKGRALHAIDHDHPPPTPPPAESPPMIGGHTYLSECDYHDEVVAGLQRTEPNVHVHDLDSTLVGTSCTFTGTFYDDVDHDAVTHALNGTLLAYLSTAIGRTFEYAGEPAVDYVSCVSEG